MTQTFPHGAYREFPGRTLHVDLTTGTQTERPLPARRRRELGGNGLLATALILEGTEPGLDPFAPETAFVMAGGPTTGLPAVGLARLTLAAKSPLTRRIAEGRVEGPIGPAFRAVHWDAVVITGASRTPTYLVLGHDGVRFRSAEDLAGLDTAQRTSLLARLHAQDEDPQVAVIGLAGEKLVRYASIVTAYGFAADRGGLGAVLGSKNCLAVVIEKAGGAAPCTEHPSGPAADPHRLARTTARYREAMPSNPLSRSQHERPGFGTWPGPGLEGYLLVDNGRTSRLGDWSAFTPAGYRARGGITASCPGCPQDCMKAYAPVHTPSPDQGRSTVAAPSPSGILHQEAIGSIAGTLGVRDLDAVLEINLRCHLLGIDPTSFAFTVAAAQEHPEVFEAFRLPRQGDGPALLRLLEEIAQGRGAGRLLGQGSSRLAEQYPQLAESAMHCGGIELGPFDLRASSGQALVAALNPGSYRYDTVEHDIDFDPLWGQKVFRDQAGEIGCPPQGYEMQSTQHGKLAFVAKLWLLWSGLDALGICLFAAPPTRSLSIDDCAELASAASGWNTTVSDLFGYGRRRLRMMQSYAQREQAPPARLPERLFTVPIDAGRFEGTSLRRSDFDRDDPRSAISLLEGMVGLSGP